MTEGINTPDYSKTSTYDYELPNELIAQEPAEPRDSSRLLVVNRENGTTEHKRFKDIVSYLKPGDLLVLNDTKVLPARVLGIKEPGGANVEIFFLHPSGNAANIWIALVRPGRKLPEGTSVLLGGKVKVTVGERLGEGLRKIVFTPGSNPLDIIHIYGSVPLPPYIKATHAPPERYQTVYSRKEKENSAAAPTAGLHFTLELLDELSAMGIGRAFLTLEVGLGTFRPVKSENIAEHVMHSELCELPAATVEAVRSAKVNGGRVVAVGTTVVRTLEAFAGEYGKLRPGALNTRLFIKPGYKFKVIDALITNFHLPMSTLLMLVTAFGGYDAIMSAYKEAVEKRYRFFSFGDVMMIL